VIASQRAGDFILPVDPKQKIGWIAGGIGVTPFVSQAASLQAKGEVRDIFLLYAVATAKDTAYYQDLVRVARVVPVVGGGEVPTGGRSGFVTEAVIRECVPDYVERLWYVSGPPPMVNAVEKALAKLGVAKKCIKTDFFPGLA
jgi:ferredoxin-NADP reductase